MDTNITRKALAYALSYARGHANRDRLTGNGRMGQFHAGMAHGQLLVAEYDMDARTQIPLELQAVKNEINFLAWVY